MKLRGILILVGLPLLAGEPEAVGISGRILQRHLPFGTILDPIFATPDSDVVVGYTRCGDSALWTGAWLAGEAFRYKATRAPEALDNVKKALAGLKGLADVTGTNLLARCMVYADDPLAAGLLKEEAGNGVYRNGPWAWVGNTSRDQFVGALFGLGTAYDLVDDAGVKAGIVDLATRLIRFLTGHNWSIVMPDGRTVTTFLVRPDELLAILQIGRRVNPDQFSTAYDVQRILLASTVSVPVGVDVLSDDSYFKFNLAYMSFYNLMRIETSSFRSFYEDAYGLLRKHTDDHMNPWFNLVDAAIGGVNATRDANTRAYLEQWLTRPVRDFKVDLRGKVKECGDQACDPIPIPQRVTTDFLWQRSPFQLTGGGDGFIESAGIDYLLPYWMARVLGVVRPLAVTPAAANGAVVAPGSIASVFGVGLALREGDPNVAVTLIDATGKRTGATVIYASPTQVNFLVPDGYPVGEGTIEVVGAGQKQTSLFTVQKVAPALFAMSGNGTGVAAATAVQVSINRPELQANVPVFSCGANGCVAVPIRLGIDTPVYVSLYATGVRGRSGLTNVQVVGNGKTLPVVFCGAQGQFPGLDQINFPLTLDFRGAGEVGFAVVVDGVKSNTVTLKIE